MSSTDRQNKLLLAEDWKRIYQSYRQADFTSYDFENIRRVCIDYIRQNYPSDFNDYIESSEFLSLIDMIAYTSQSIAFRVDLNARDNFLELAERRDSVLRLSRLVGYNAKRNLPAQGLLKFASVSTTQNLIDANGRNISGQIITWNDPSNPNWYEQFIKVMNAAMSQNQQFGNPCDKSTIYGIPTEQYRFESSNTDVPIYSFTKTVAGRSMNFEITSTTFKGQNYIYEESPKVGNSLSCIYRDDGRGASSSSSGFFLNVVQGVLNAGSFNISQPTTNEIVDIAAQNINNNDVWLYKLDQNGNEVEDWVKVPSFEGTNIIYNSINKNVRNIYEVITRTGDSISLMFSDGTFGNLPLGDFRVYYRISNGLSYTINTQDIRSVLITVPYTSRQNQPEILSISLSLATSISNASETESNDQIKTTAPATYYTQNRMITGEDYNISPLSISQQVMKIKTINRTSSGISRYFDLIDPTGKYSSTNLFGTDGIIYQEDYNYYTRFSYITRSDIEGVIYNTIFDILSKAEIKNFYYSKYATLISSLETNQWVTVTADTGMTTGYIKNPDTGIIYQLGDYSSSSNNFRYYKSGSLIKFIAPTIQKGNVLVQYYFDLDNNNQLVGSDETLPLNYTDYMWVEVISVIGNGTASNTGVLPNGLGPVTMNKTLPTGITYNNTVYNVSISKIIPKWVTTISSSVISNMIDLIQDNKPFGLRYDISTTSWTIVYESELSISNTFSISTNGSGWLLLFTTDNEYYTILSRESRFVFESDYEMGFYYDKSNTIYDSKTSTIIKDLITILRVNTQPNSRFPLSNDVVWNIVNEFNGLDGFVDGKKVVLGFSNQDNNDTVDDPEAFSKLVESQLLVTSIEIGKIYKIVTLGDTNWNAVGGTSNKNYNIGDVFVAATTGSGSGIVLNITYIIEERYIISDGQEDYKYVSNNDNKVKFLTTQPTIIGLYSPGQYFYFIDSGIVTKLDSSGSQYIPSLDYKIYLGRDNLKFQYTHSADYESRIDPGVSNIMDIFVLTKTYDTLFRQWLMDSTLNKPLPPSSNEIYDMLAPTLNTIKAVSDEIVFHPVSYTVLFGSTADISLQATFKLTKNTSQVISDNEIKSKVITLINQFFSLENWDFGDTFYFTELAAYVIKELAPDITNFVIVPKQSGLNFGSLFEIKSSSDKLFINGATVDDIEIISGITPSNIKTINGTTDSSSVLSSQYITSSLYGL